MNVHIILLMYNMLQVYQVVKLIILRIIKERKDLNNLPCGINSKTDNFLECKTANASKLGEFGINLPIATCNIGEFKFSS